MWLLRPNGFGELDMLGHCAGYEVISPSDGRYVVVHQEHRMVLPAAWAARADGVLKQAPFLLRLDAHPDYEEGHRDYQELQSRIKTIEDCLLFANALNPQDDDWVEPAVKMGWVGNVLTLGVQATCEPLCAVKDASGKDHTIGCIRWDLSCPIDEGVKALVAQAFECANGEPGDLWLDIDLDFGLAILSGGGLRVRGGCELGRWLDTSLDVLGGPARNDLGSLIERAIRRTALVTVATEPKFCGGHSGVSQAIELLETMLTGSVDVLRPARMER